MEAKAARISLSSDMLTLITGAKAAGGIFDHPKTMLSRNPINSTHVRCEAKQVDRQDGFGAWCNLFFNLSRVDIEGVEIDVAKDHRAAEMLHYVGG